MSAFPNVKPTLAWAHDTGSDLAKTNVYGGRSVSHSVLTMPAS
jgi:hypothetical protein